MYAVLDNVCFVSDSEINQTQIVIYGEAVTERNVQFRSGL
jgi:hypothetical protein